MGLLLPVVIGIPVGLAARAIFRTQLPERVDIAALLATVGAACGALGGSLLGTSRMLEPSASLAIASATGAVIMLIAYGVLPRPADEPPSRVDARPSSPA